MVTRRAVLKGTAAASIGAIAAVHGATPVEAAAVGGCGYGPLQGGVVGSFQKDRDAFQVALKWHKVAAEVFIKEDLGGGVSIFSKFFNKEWVEGQPVTLSDSFPNLTDASLSFVKIDPSSASFFLKYGTKQMIGTLDASTEKYFLKVEELNTDTDFQIG